MYDVGDYGSGDEKFFSVSCLWKEGTHRKLDEEHGRDTDISEVRLHLILHDSDGRSEWEGERDRRKTDSKGGMKEKGHENNLRTGVVDLRSIDDCRLTRTCSSLPVGRRDREKGRI